MRKLVVGSGSETDRHPGLILRLDRLRAGCLIQCVVWTDRFIKGSPQNSISAVVAEPWGTQAPDLSLIATAPAAPPQ